MAVTAPDIGTGSTITFGTSSFSARIMSANFSGWERAVIRTSYMGSTTAHSFVPGDLYDPGELTVEVQFPSATSPVTIMTAVTETITTTFSGSATGNTLAASGFVRSYTINDPLEDLMTATLVIKFTGAFTYANS